MANKKKSESFAAKPEKEQLAALALARQDVERIQKECALEPYAANLGKYDLNTRIQQGKWLLKQQAGIHFALGCVLMEIKERESLQSLAKILSDDFGGISQRHAYNLITFAKKCVDLKKIKEFAEDNWSKVIAMLNGNTEEQLKEIEEKGLHGKALDEFDGMSVRQFKQQLRKYKGDTEKVVRAETHTLKVQLEKTLKELDEAKAQLPQAEDIAWQLKQFEEVEKKAQSFITACRRFVFDPRMKAEENLEIQGAVEKLIAETTKSWRHLANDWHQLTEAGE
ncbi:MAG: hypothetical protein HY265_06310 [Deltaproteobacteria bacterium]|nr:hypothetical protein [Deltaproteobacteria bacterium]